MEVSILRKKIIWFIAVLFCMVIVGCGKKTNVQSIADTIEIDYQGQINTNVTHDILLPVENINGATLTWTSNHEAIEIVGNKGVVKPQKEDVSVTLTVFVRLESKEAKKDFTLVVKKEDILVNIDDIVKSIEIGYQDGDYQQSVTKDITLPNESIQGVIIVWTSNHEAIEIVGNKGVVKPQEEDVSVTLTVTATLDENVGDKHYILLVKGNVSLETLLQDIDIIYKDEDHAYFVTQNIELPNEPIGGATVTWHSESYAVQIEGNIGYVIRSNEDMLVTITVSLHKEGTRAQKSFDLVIKQKQVEIVPEEVKLMYGGGNTTSMGEGNNANLVSLDESIFTVTSTKPGSNYVGLNQNGTIRLYQPSGGVTLSVVIDSTYKITKVEFVFDTTVADTKITLGETVILVSQNQIGSKKTYEHLNITHFSIQNVHSSNVQIHIKEIQITYESLEADKNSLPEFSDIDKEVYSLNVGETFMVPLLNATDAFGNYLVVTYETNLNVLISGEYVLTYSATNEIGSSYLSISIYVFEEEIDINIELIIDEEVPSWIYTYVEFTLPSARAYDFLGNELIVIQSVETLYSKYEGTHIIWYYAKDNYGNEVYEEFSIEVLKNPDYTGPEPGDYLPYYEGIDELTGEELKEALHSIISVMTLLSYSNTSIPLSNIDRDLVETNKVYLIYNGATVTSTWDSGSTWNKEHVWAKSLYGLSDMKGSHKGMGSDMHNLRAANPTINNSRGNKIFVDGAGTYGAVGSGWYPGDDHIGDVARIVLYMHVAWDYDINVGDMDMFLRWHEQDEVDDFEMARNERIFGYQYNRNPFIDHPKLVELIWGSSYETVSLETSFEGSLKFSGLVGYTTHLYVN